MGKATPRTLQETVGKSTPYAQHGGDFAKPCQISELGPWFVLNWRKMLKKMGIGTLP